MELRLRTCTLRRFRVGDEFSLVAHANNRKVWINLRDRFPHPYTRHDAEKWIAFAAHAEPLTSWAIDIDGHAVGGIGVHPQEDVFRRSAEVGYWLGEPFWGRGVATDALVAITEHTFATTDLTRLFAGVFAWNPASGRVLEKAGYILEGRLRDAVWKDGQLVDQLLFARTR